VDRGSDSDLAGRVRTFATLDGIELFVAKFALTAAVQAQTRSQSDVLVHDQRGVQWRSKVEEPGSRKETSDRKGEEIKRPNRNWCFSAMFRIWP